MGEKGIAADAPSAAAVAGLGSETTSVIERAGTVVTTSITEVGTDVAATVRDKTIEAAADHVVAEGRERLQDEDEREDPPSSTDPG